MLVLMIPIWSMVNKYIAQALDFVAISMLLPRPTKRTYGGSDDPAQVFFVAQPLQRADGLSCCCGCIINKPKNPVLPLRSNDFKARTGQILVYSRLSG